MKAIVADPIGGPENLKYVDVPVPEPGEGEVLVKIEAIGVNYIDTYFRAGFYKAPESPVKLGSEAAGKVVKAGRGANWQVGQRVAYSMARGSYAEYAVVPQQFLVELPAAVSFENGAAVMLQGMTAHYLTHSTYPLKAGDTCLIHAAAGGAGLMLVQIAKIAGATVIGTVSTTEKAQLAKDNGADHIIFYTEQDFVTEVKRITNGKGVNVVYDSVGKTTFHKSLDCLRPTRVDGHLRPIERPHRRNRPPPSEPKRFALPRPAQAWAITLATPRNCAGDLQISSNGSPTAVSNFASTRSIPWPTPPTPTATWKAAKPPASFY